jgi:hypothetical protein
MFLMNAVIAVFNSISTSTATSILTTKSTYRSLSAQRLSERKVEICYRPRVSSKIVLSYCTKRKHKIWKELWEISDHRMTVWHCWVVGIRK